MTRDQLMERRARWRAFGVALRRCLLTGVVAWAAVDAFGWLHGLGIIAAVVLLGTASK